MTTNPQQPHDDTPHVTTRTAADCESGSCKTGICSPCVVIWGVVAVWLLINALWSLFQ